MRGTGSLRQAPSHMASMCRKCVPSESCSRSMRLNVARKHCEEQCGRHPHLQLGFQRHWLLRRQQERVLVLHSSHTIGRISAKVWRFSA